MKTLKKSLFEGCEMKTADMTSIKGGKTVVDRVNSGCNYSVPDAGGGWCEDTILYDDGSLETVIYQTK
jgi:hypothetical protein